MPQVRTDPIKIAMYQRALPQTKRDLGEWERALWFQLYAAVVQVSPPPWGEKRGGKRR